MGTPDTIQFNEDYHALRLLARRIYSQVAKDHRGISIPNDLVTVAPRLDTDGFVLESYKWPHDRAADLICAWRIETHGRP